MLDACSQRCDASLTKSHEESSELFIWMARALLPRTQYSKASSFSDTGRRDCWIQFHDPEHIGLKVSSAKLQLNSGVSRCCRSIPSRPFLAGPVLSMLSLHRALPARIKWYIPHISVLQVIRSDSWFRMGSPRCCLNRVQHTCPQDGTCGDGPESHCMLMSEYDNASQHNCT